MTDKVKLDQRIWLVYYKMQKTEHDQNPKQVLDSIWDNPQMASRRFDEIKAFLKVQSSDVTSMLINKCKNINPQTE